MKLDAFGIGTITKDLNGSYTSIYVNTRCPLTPGVEYLIINKYTGEYSSVSVNKKPPKIVGGEVKVSIDEQILNAPEGSLIIIDPAWVEVAFDYLHKKVEELEEKLNDKKDD